MLSNTATPYYYGQFREQVLRGEIPVNKWISKEMNRIDGLILNPDVYYDRAVVEGFIYFCESELTLSDGSDLVLLDSFKLWAEQLFGWYYFIEQPVFDPKTRTYQRRKVKKRLTKKQYIITARGSAKSMYASNLQAYFLVVDDTTTHQITTAPTMKQSEEVMLPFKTAISRARGPVFNLLTQGSINNTTGNKADRVKLTSTKKGIENFVTGSLLEIRPMSIDKLQGLGVKFSTVDEWLSCDIREDCIGAIEQGATKIQDYAIVAISSEGTVRNGPGDTIKMELEDILNDKRWDPYTSIWYYRLDDIEEINYPELWVKANPNIGITVSYEDYQRDVERAENVPAARNDIIAKRFGIPVEGFTYYFTFDEIQKHPRKEYWQMPCSLGADMSQGDDFCSFSFLFPLASGKFGIRTLNFISQLKYEKLPGAMRKKYDEFIEENSLIVMDGAILNMMDVYDEVDKFIVENEFTIISFGYDPYNAKEFVQRWITEYGEFGVVKVPQGVKTESVPLGELKRLAEARLLLFDEDIMEFAMGNCIAIEDTNGNRKLSKKRYEEKIDPFAATLDAFVAYKQNLEAYA
ncbi:MAG: terminase [Pseudobutyrivibrio sp.]|nr:terminase [Pseudobutyrivibrio sp.]